MKDLVQRLTDALEGALTVYADPDYQKLIAEARAALAAPVVSQEEWAKGAEPFIRELSCDAVIKDGAGVADSVYALRAYIRTHPAFVVPEGFALVPMEPTIDGDSFNDIKKIYKAIIAVGSVK